MSKQEEDYFEQEEESYLEKVLQKMSRYYRQKVDPLIIYKNKRWIFTLIVFVLLILRIIQLQGFYVIAYMEGLLALQLTVQFFTPLGLPDIEEDDDSNLIVDLQQLPINQSSPSEHNNNEEFKPMIRSVSEFKYWQNMNNSCLISLFLTNFECLDLPVFWPFLLIYFLGLVVVTFKKLWDHSNKYNYTFFDKNKIKYNNGSTYNTHNNK